MRSGESLLPSTSSYINARGAASYSWMAPRSISALRGRCCKANQSMKLVLTVDRIEWRLRFGLAFPPNCTAIRPKSWGSEQLCRCSASSSFSTDTSSFVNHCCSLRPCLTDGKILSQSAFPTVCHPSSHFAFLIRKATSVTIDLGSSSITF